MSIGTKLGLPWTTNFQPAPRNGSENLFAVRTDQAILQRVEAYFRGLTALCSPTPLAIVAARLPR